MGNQQHGANPTNNIRKEKQSVPRYVNHPNVKETGKQPQKILLEKKNTVIQHTQPENNQNNVGNQQRGVNQTNAIRKYQPTLHQNFNPTNIRVTNKRPQDKIQPKKNSAIQKSQPRTNQRKQIIKNPIEKKRLN